MISSMTGFGAKEAKAAALGKISVEIRSTNHKFLETVIHLPQGYLFLEDRIKKDLEKRLKRGRVVCVIGINAEQLSTVSLNQRLLGEYILALKKIKGKTGINGSISMDTLVGLPGVVALSESAVPKERVWSHLSRLLNSALGELVKMRQKEGKALCGYLRVKGNYLKKGALAVEQRFKKVIQEKTACLKTDEERCSFLKSSDISEEIERLSFHISNFLHTLSKDGPVGKEMDFIAQEMQRETNTMGAKSCDKVISTQVVGLKSQIEAIREQVQNIE